MEFDESRFRKVQFPHPVVVHWILNPSLVINELVFGQRIPKLMFVERGGKHLLSPQYWVPCPACAEVHDGKLWSGQHAFGHWFGCVCPSCGKKIPTLLNVASVVCLTALLPLTYLIKRRWEKAYLIAERERARNIALTLHIEE